MPKPPKEVLERVVGRKMPGYKIVPKKKPSDRARDSSRQPQPDAPDVEALRKKYLRGRNAPRRAPETDATRSGGPATAPPYDDVIVAVEPEDRSRDAQLPGGGRSKRVVISGDTNEIIGRQG